MTGDCDLSKAGQLRTGPALQEAPSNPAPTPTGSGSRWQRTRSTASTPWPPPPSRWRPPRPPAGRRLRHLPTLLRLHLHVPGRRAVQQPRRRNVCRLVRLRLDELRTYNGSSYNDDGGEGLNARMYIRGFPAGTHFIEVTTVPHQADPADEVGSYTLTLTELEDDSTLGPHRKPSAQSPRAARSNIRATPTRSLSRWQPAPNTSSSRLLTGYWSGSLLINPKS